MYSTAWYAKEWVKLGHFYMVHNSSKGQTINRNPRKIRFISSHQNPASQFEFIWLVRNRFLRSSDRLSTINVPSKNIHHELLCIVKNMYICICCMLFNAYSKYIQPIRSLSNLLANKFQHLKQFWCPWWPSVLQTRPNRQIHIDLSRM